MTTKKESPYWQKTKWTADMQSESCSLFHPTNQIVNYEMMHHTHFEPSLIRRGYANYLWMSTLRSSLQQVTHFVAKHFHIRHRHFHLNTQWMKKTRRYYEIGNEQWGSGLKIKYILLPYTIHQNMIARQFIRCFCVLFERGFKHEETTRWMEGRLDKQTMAAATVVISISILPLVLGFSLPPLQSEPLPPLEARSLSEFSLHC